MKGLIVAVLLVSVIAVASGINCYNCIWTKSDAGETGENCKKPDDDAPFGDCGPTITQCYKIAVDTDAGEGRWRSCSPSPVEEKEECTEIEYSGQKATACYCKGDKCNGASSLVSGFAIIPAILGTAYALRQ